MKYGAIEKCMNNDEEIRSMHIAKDGVSSRVVYEIWGKDCDEKMELLKKAHELGYSIRGWAFGGLPLEAMETIFNDCFDKKVGPTNIRDVDLWKISNSRIPEDNDKLKAVILALSYGVHMMDEIERIIKYDVEILNIVAQKAVSGKNICRYIHEGVTVDELKNL